MSEQSAISERFNAFHLEVAVISERMSWIFSQLELDHPGISLLQSTHEALERSLQAQDCRGAPCPMS